MLLALQYLNLYLHIEKNVIINRLTRYIKNIKFFKNFYFKNIIQLVLSLIYLQIISFKKCLSCIFHKNKKNKPFNCIIYVKIKKNVIFRPFTILCRFIVNCHQNSISNFLFIYSKFSLQFIAKLLHVTVNNVKFRLYLHFKCIQIGVRK